MTAPRGSWPARTCIGLIRRHSMSSSLLTRWASEFDAKTVSYAHSVGISCMFSSEATLPPASRNYADACGSAGRRLDGEVVGIYISARPRSPRLETIGRSNQMGTFTNLGWSTSSDEIPEFDLYRAGKQLEEKFRSGLEAAETRSRQNRPSSRTRNKPAAQVAAAHASDRGANRPAAI